jgi:hypothetical protein
MNSFIQVYPHRLCTFAFIPVQNRGRVEKRMHRRVVLGFQFNFNAVIRNSPKKFPKRRMIQLDWDPSIR